MLHLVGCTLEDILSKIDHSRSMVFSLAIVLAREVVVVLLHAPQTKTEHFWLFVWANCHLEKLHHY